MLYITFKFGKNVGLVTIVIGILIGIYFPSRHARHYEYVAINSILNNLHFESIFPNINIKNCTYDDIIFASDNEIRIDDITQLKVHLEPKSGKYCMILLNDFHCLYISICSDNR